MKKILVVLGIVLILAMVKVFTDSPPPGKASWREAFSDYFRGRKSTNLPRAINSERYTQEEFEQAVEGMHTALTDREMKELNNLSIRAIDMLPDNERTILLDLQEKFAYGGYKALSDEEISTMQRLNNKAMNLLPKADLERLQYLMYKVNKVLKNK